jgi:hypothetical protein
VNEDRSETGAGKRVLIVGQLDRFANGLKPVEIQRFLHARGHDVRLFDTYYLSKVGGRAALALFALHAAHALITRTSKRARRGLFYYFHLAESRVRRSLLSSSLTLDEFDLIICETPFDAVVVTIPTSARRLYDCPTPWADELYFEGRLTERQHRKLRRIESDLFESVDHLAFHWETYGQYAVKHYGISGRNLMTLNFGCNPASRRATFRDPPRVVYLGSLSSRFIDLPLLSRLARIYPHIDVYGGPPPDPRLGLRYLGYAAPSVVADYQLGLITCTKEELRRDGFSAKHLEYFAHGLPVLVPAWRRNLHLLEGSVPYDEETFRSKIDALADEAEWRRLSDLAYAQAQRLSWDRTLQPLETLLEVIAGASPTPARRSDGSREPSQLEPN